MFSSSRATTAGDQPQGPNRLNRLNRLRVALARWRRRAVEAVRRPGPDRDTALLLAKAALATVVAWQVAVHVLGSTQPFYAPLAALLVVDQTMVRSLWASAQRIVAVVLGMSVAWLVGSVVGVTWWSMAPVLLVALVIGRWHRLGDHGIQVPVMVLLSLLTVKGTDSQFTYVTIVETVVGGVIGVATNAVVLAPLHIHEPRDAVRSLTTQVRELLREMADGLREGWDAEDARRWYDTSTDIVRLAPTVSETIDKGRESTRFNPRHGVRPAAVDWMGYQRTVETVRRTQWQVSGIARTLVDAADERERQPAPARSFLQRYADALDEIGSAVDHFGLREGAERDEVDRHLRAALAALDELGTWVRETPLDDPQAWPAYGALILDAQRLAHELSATKEEATVPTDAGPLRISWPERLRRLGSP